MRTEFGNVEIKASDDKTKKLGCKIREDGLLIMADMPLFVGDDLKAAGVTIENPSRPVEKFSNEELKHALHLDSERVTLVDDKHADKVQRMLAGEPEDTRERQNAFLWEKGYRWEKRGVYHSNPGEMVDVWFLLGPGGEVVCGWKDSIGDQLASTGPSLKTLLTQLGYYGQEAIDKSEAKGKISAERREMRAKVDAYFADDANRTGEVFEDAESLFTVRPVSIEKHYPRRQFRIESDCIWKESHNRSDGDDWSLNNSSYGIATQYKYDQEIADCIRKLSA